MAELQGRQLERRIGARAVVNPNVRLMLRLPTIRYVVVGGNARAAARSGPVSAGVRRASTNTGSPVSASTTIVGSVTFGSSTGAG